MVQENQESRKIGEGHGLICSLLRTLWAFEEEKVPMSPKKKLRPVQEEAATEQRMGHGLS